jgi:hypothetical protein
MAPTKPNDGIAKLVRAEDAKKAMAEYHQAAAAVDANTVRLRALRLEREAAVAKEAPPPAPKRKTAKKAKPATGSLSQWLKEREGSGRKN